MMIPDRYDRADYDSEDPMNFQPLEEICGCDARKTRQYDKEGNIVDELICPDCLI